MRAILLASLLVATHGRLGGDMRIGDSPTTGVTTRLGVAPRDASDPPIADFTDCYDVTPETNETFRALDVSTCTAGIEHITPTPQPTGASEVMTLLWEYRGSDATATTLSGQGATPTLTTTGAGAAPDVSKVSPFSTTDDNGVWETVSGGKLYRAAGTGDGDIALEDIYFVYIGAIKNSKVPFAKAAGTVDTLGYGIYNKQFWMSDGVTSALATGSAPTSSQDEWYILSGLADRDENFQSAINGQLDSSPPALGSIGSITNTNLLSVGANSVAANANPSVTAYAAIWTCDGCLPAGDTDEQNWIVEQQARIFGLWPQVASDSATSVVWSSSQDSTVYNSTTGVVHRTMRNWPWVHDTWGLYGQDDGAGNIMQESEDLSASWTLDDADDSIAADATTAPDQETTMDAIVASATGGESEHCARQVTASSAAEGTFKMHVAGGAKTWAYAENTLAAKLFEVWINTADCTLGATTHGFASTYIEATSVGCFFAGNIAGSGTGANTIRLCPADGDNDTVYTGTGAEDAYFWGLAYGASTLDHGSAMRYQPNTTGTASATLDQLYYRDTDDSNFSSPDATWEMDNAWIPGATASDIYYSGGGYDSASAGTDYATTISLTAPTNAFWWVRVAGGTQIQLSPTGLTTQDGSFHTYCAEWDTSEATLKVDGTLEATDSTVGTVPSTYDTWMVGGQSAPGTTGGNVWTRNMKRFSAQGNCTP